MFKEGSVQVTFPCCELGRRRKTSQLLLVVKNLPASAGDQRDLGPIPGLGRSPGGESGNALQYYCLEDPMDRGAWRATVHGVAKSSTRLKRLSTHACERRKNTGFRKQTPKWGFSALLFLTNSIISGAQSRIETLDPSLGPWGQNSDCCSLGCYVFLLTRNCFLFSGLQGDPPHLHWRWWVVGQWMRLPSPSKGQVWPRPDQSDAPFLQQDLK